MRAWFRRLWRRMRHTCLSCGGVLPPYGTTPADVFQVLNRKHCRWCNKRDLHGWNYGASATIVRRALEEAKG